jgi:hypothetical protein
VVVLITNTSVEEDEPGKFGINTQLPPTTNAHAPNVPITTVSFEDTSNIGSPEMSFTDINTPVKQSVMENNCP